MKYDATGYEQPWRENFELRAAGAWLLGALVISIGAAGMSWQLGFVLWQEWGLALTIALIMFIIRFRAARRLGKLQRTVLYGRNLTFIDFDGLREKLAQRIPVKLSLAKRFANWRTKKKGEEIPYPQFVSGGPMKTVWLGTGFAWQTRHTQRAQEILKHPRLHLWTTHDCQAPSTVTRELHSEVAGTELVERHITAADGSFGLVPSGTEPNPVKRSWNSEHGR